MAPRTRMTSEQVLVQRAARRREWEARTGLLLTTVEARAEETAEAKTDPIEGRRFLGKLLFGQLRRMRS